MDFWLLVFWGGQLRWGAARAVATAAQPGNQVPERDVHTATGEQKTAANLVQLHEEAPEREVGGEMDELARPEIAHKTS